MFTMGEWADHLTEHEEEYELSRQAIAEKGHLLYPDLTEEEELARFSSVVAVRTVIRDLPGLKQVLTNRSEEDDRPGHSILLKFGSKRQAQDARERIIEEHIGGDWPPFGVAFASPVSLSFGGLGCGAE